MSTLPEREVMLTGIGGQGVQLAAKVLALAAMRDGREVLSLGTYGGTMRGGNTDATVIVGPEPIVSPPIVARTWSAMIVHPRYFETIRPKLRANGIVVVDEDLLDEPLATGPTELLSLKATTLAREIDAPKAAALVMLGAFAAATGLVSAKALDEALAESLPSYRQQTLESNLRALGAGREAVTPLSTPAWNTEAA